MLPFAFQINYKLYSIQTQLPCHFHNGYIEVKHPQTGKWVKEHRFVFEEYCGTIPKNKDIHHIDENPANNRLSNLQEKWHDKHARDHMVGNNHGKANRLFTDTHKPCPSCNQMLPHSSFGKCKSTPSGLNDYCLVCARDKSKQTRARMTPAQREARQEYQRKRRASETHEEREARLAKRRQKRAIETPAQREARLEYHRQYKARKKCASPV